jgi:cyanophycinase-like exopeptidase
VLRRLAPTLTALAFAACTPASTGDGEGESSGGEGEGEPDAGPSGPCPALPAGAVEGSIGALDAANDAQSAGRRIVLMGGGPEVDRGARLFVEGAIGGDVLVLRATGAVDSYTPYFADELGADPDAASVATVRLDDASAGADPAVLCRVLGAEALWLAGGDQSDYLVRWPAALHDAIAARASAGGALGGTSAGAMALGGVAFDARVDSVTSDEALADPDGAFVTVSASPFAPPELHGVVVDTHFGARDREGRLLAFLAVALVDHADALGDQGALGVGLEEGSAILIDDGAFTVLADDGGFVALYLAAGPADVSAALDLDGVARVTLADGDTGAWPPSFAGAAALRVTDGVVVVE